MVRLLKGMPPLRPSRARRRRVLMLIAGVAGFGTAALVGIAGARTFTLQVAKNAPVKNTMGVTKHENIVVNSRRKAVYWLTGDSKRHPECRKGNGCFAQWPPVTVSSPRNLSKAPGVPGRLTVWHRNGFFQVVDNGHPLYRFAFDMQRNVATGEGIVNFGGTWHVLKALSQGTPTSTMSSTGTTTTSTTTTCLYPPYCY